MTNQTASSTGAVNAFDDWKSIATAIFMALVGYTVMVSVPVLSTALVDKVGFTEVEVGRIWGADMGGLAIGAIISAILVGRVNRRHLVLAGAVLAMIANALCITYVTFDEVLWLRAAAGVGSGILTGVAVATLGGTTKPVIAFNLELLGFAFSTAISLHFLPKLTMNEIYIVMIVIAAICVLLVGQIPARPLTKEQLAEQEKGEFHTEDWHVPKILPIICLIAVCFTYINIGGYYTYIELAALKDGIAEEWMTPVLTWASFFAIVGCVIAYYATRFGLFKPLFISLFLMAATVYMASVGITDINIVISLFGFMTLWTFADVYQSAMMAHMDRSGALVALLPAVQGFGQFLGPNMAASVLDAGYGYSQMFIVSGSMAIVALILYMGVLVYMRRHQAAAA